MNTEWFLVAAESVSHWVPARPGWLPSGHALDERGYTNLPGAVCVCVCVSGEEGSVCCLPARKPRCYQKLWAVGRADGGQICKIPVGAGGGSRGQVFVEGETRPCLQQLSCKPKFQTPWSSKTWWARALKYIRVFSGQMSSHFSHSICPVKSGHVSMCFVHSVLPCDNILVHVMGCTVIPQIHMLKSWPLEPQSVITFGERVCKEVTGIKWSHVAGP